MRSDPHPASPGVDLPVLVLDAGSSWTKLALMVDDRRLVRLTRFPSSGLRHPPRGQGTPNDPRRSGATDEDERLRPGGARSSGVREEPEPPSDDPRGHCRPNPRAAGVTEATARWTAMLHETLAAHDLRLSDLHHVVASSVVPHITDALRALSEQHTGGVPVHLVTPDTAPLRIDYRPLGDLGADRIANAVAAWDRWGGPVVVVDIGTAITCDLVTADGRFAGGAIAAGPRTSYRSLVDAAPRLSPRLDTVDVFDLPDRWAPAAAAGPAGSAGSAGSAAAVGPGERRGRTDDAPAGGVGVAVGTGLASHLPVVGTSTRDSLRVGAFRGAAALVDGLVRDYQRLVGPCPVVATGGLASPVARLSEKVTAIDPDLTLRGVLLACGAGDLARQEP